MSDLQQLIFFEKQEGALCAQHCLNNLLQDSYFTAVELSKIAQDLDQLELQQLSGREKQERMIEFQRESPNYNDTGYFSLQVIQKALQAFDLKLILFGAQEMAVARKSPQYSSLIQGIKQRIFVITATIGLRCESLEIQFIDVRDEGYTIFCVIGTLPQSQADSFAANHPIPPKTTDKGTTPFSTKGYRLGSSSNDLSINENGESDPDLEKALAMSLAENSSSTAALNRAIAESLEEADDLELQQALAQSLEKGTKRILSEQEQLRQKRLQRFDNKKSQDCFHVKLGRPHFSKHGNKPCKP